MVPFWGPDNPRFDAVFNKTASLTQSLYARARIGIVCLGSNLATFGPLQIPPLIYCQLDTGHFKGPKYP